MFRPPACFVLSPHCTKDVYTPQGSSSDMWTVTQIHSAAGQENEGTAPYISNIIHEPWWRLSLYGTVLCNPLYKNDTFPTDVIAPPHSSYCFKDTNSTPSVRLYRLTYPFLQTNPPKRQHPFPVDKSHEKSSSIDPSTVARGHCGEGAPSYIHMY
jgi:hypothetical protein